MDFNVVQIKEWVSVLFTIIGAGVTFASVIVKLTPTQSDDDFLSKVITVLDKLSVFNPNGTKIVADK